MENPWNMFLWTTIYIWSEGGRDLCLRIAQWQAICPNFQPPRFYAKFQYLCVKLIRSYLANFTLFWFGSDLLKSIKTKIEKSSSRNDTFTSHKHKINQYECDKCDVYHLRPKMIGHIMKIDISSLGTNSTCYYAKVSKLTTLQRSH